MWSRHANVCRAILIHWMMCDTATSSFIPQGNASPSSRSDASAFSRGEFLYGARRDTLLQDDAVVDFGTVGFVLLAGGTGSRMKADVPKQFLTLRGIPVLHHSLFLCLDRLSEYARDHGVSGPPIVVLVMDSRYHPDYQSMVDTYGGRLVFAIPGKERQGSVQNGLNKLLELAAGTCRYVAVHDSARPLVTVSEICRVVSDAKMYGAAVLGVPVKATIKESDDDGTLVRRTIPRERLWEVHTPQVIDINIFQRGFAKVIRERLEVTDDVSIVEALGEPVKLTRGEYTNLKLTTPEDMDVASAILEERDRKAKHNSFFK